MEGEWGGRRGSGPPEGRAPLTARAVPPAGALYGGLPRQAAEELSLQVPPAAEGLGAPRGVGAGLQHGSRVGAAPAWSRRGWQAAAAVVVFINCTFVKCLVKMSAASEVRRGQSLCKRLPEAQHAENER